MGVGMTPHEIGLLVLMMVPVLLLGLAALHDV
jgi:hypothetical protein